jgi:hypothetical protein
MRRLRDLAGASLLAGTALMAGCLNDSSSDSAMTSEDAQDERALEETVELDIPEYASADIFVYGEDGTGAGRAAIEPLHWWRELENVDKTIQITINKPEGGPNTADVAITCDASGILHVLACADSTITPFRKEFKNTAVRSLYFERPGRPIVHPRRGWKLRALSGVLAESPGTTRQILSVRVQAGDVDETITNVTDLVRLGQILELPRGEEAIVTVDTGDATDVVYLHVRRHRMRFPLTNNGDGTFTGAYVTPEGRGVRHAVVDVLSHASLYDDVAPYDNVAWGIPYWIAGEDDELDDEGGA